MSNKEFLQAIRDFIAKMERRELKRKLKNNYYLKINKK